MGTRAPLRLATLCSAIMLANACATTGTPAVAGGPTQGELVAIAVTANQGEIDTSQPAVSGATTAPVRQFAQRMVADHGAAIQRLQALGITPQQNDYTQRLQQNARQSATNIALYSGAALDRAYMDNQVALHEFALRLIDGYLLTYARDGRLRTQLTEMRTAVAAHLTEARQVRSGL